MNDTNQSEVRPSKGVGVGRAKHRSRIGPRHVPHPHQHNPMPNTPEQKGRTERTHFHLVGRVPVAIFNEHEIEGDQNQQPMLDPIDFTFKWQHLK